MGSSGRQADSIIFSKKIAIANKQLVNLKSNKKLVFILYLKDYKSRETIEINKNKRSINYNKNF